MTLQQFTNGYLVVVMLLAVTAALAFIAKVLFDTFIDP